MPLPEQIDIFTDAQSPAIPCRSREEVEAILRGIHQRCDPEFPICALVRIPGYDLYVGLGANPTFVAIQGPESGDCAITRGDATQTGVKEFYGCGGHTQFEARLLVPFEGALAAVLEFVEHQRRSARVAWQGEDEQPLS